MGEPATTVNKRRRADPLLTYPGWIKGEQALIEAIDNHTNELKITNKYLGEIVGLADDTLGFVRKTVLKYVPWAVAAISVLWPTVGKIIASLPALPQ